MFKNTPLLRPVDNDMWKLEEPLTYITADFSAIVVPAGFLTDLASIPRVFHPIIPVNGKHRAPAIVHDFLYCTQTMSRSECDSIFLEAMEAAGVRWSQRMAMYLAVRVGGWLPFKGYTDKLKNDRAAFLSSCGLTDANI